MHIIDIEFERFNEITLDRLLGEIGVYVIWDSQAQVRCTYIGEGVILERLLQHYQRFALPLDGYIGPIYENSPQRAKANAEIVEATLMKISKDTDRGPTYNLARGKLHNLGAIFRTHGTLRVNVRGYDPLMPPQSARLIPSAKKIVLRDFVGDTALLEHDWRLRRRMS